MLIKKFFITAVLIFAFALAFYLYQKSTHTNNPAPTPETKKTDISKDPPRIVSTKPDPLENNIVSATDIVEITFNRPLENEGQFKIRIEPKIDYKIELTNNRKTARIIPLKPYPLGSGFTLFIDPDTKFDGVGEWKEDKIFHFKTITYRGV